MDVGTLHLWTHVVEPALADLTVYYRPKVMEMQGMRVRVRACGGLSLRPGESREQYDELERKHLQQQRQRTVEQQQQQRACAGRRVDVVTLLQQGFGQYLEGEGLDLSYVDAEAVRRAAFGPLREVLGAAVEAGAGATGGQPGGGGKGAKGKGKCGGGGGGGGGGRDAKGQKKSRVRGKAVKTGADGGGGGGLATAGSVEGAGCSGGAQTECKAEGESGSSGCDGGGAEGTAGSDALRLPGLAVVPANSRDRSHRLVLLVGPFFAVLGEGDVLTSWVSKMRDRGQRGGRRRREG